MSSKGFKFGRGYTWWVVNTDFATLYPEAMAIFTEEQISMLAGIPSQFQGRQERGVVISPRAEDHEWSRRVENMQRNNERDTIVLTRRDLARNKRTILRGVIDYNDFTEQSISRQEFMRASIVIFMDDDGNTKTIKNRYGSTN